jgi:membrane protease YdiL (CAAX protease family)
MNQESIDTVSSSSMPPASRKEEFLAWLIIFVLVLILVAGNTIRRARAGDDNPLNDVRMRLLAQEAIAFKSLLPDRPAAGLADPTLRVIQEFSRQGNSAGDEIRAAILVAYLQGPPAGSARLSRISGGHDSELTDDISVLDQIFHHGPEGLDHGAGDRLIRRYGYFGRLALAVDAGKNSEPRKSIETAALRTLVLLGALALSIVFMLILSLGLFVTAIVVWRKGQIRAAYTPQSSKNPIYVEAFALYLVLFVVLSLIIHGLGLSGANWNWLAWMIIPVVILLIRKRSKSDPDWRIALGWYSGRGWLWEAGAGIAGYLASLPIVAIGLGITFVLVRVTGIVPRDALGPLLQSHALTLYGIACVFAPVLEETMFRGALFHYLRGRWSWLASAALVSFIFAVIHPQGWVAIPALGAIAMSLAALREWRGSIIASMAAHSFNNFLAVTFALLLLRNG